MMLSPGIGVGTCTSVIRPLKCQSRLPEGSYERTSFFAAVTISVRRSFSQTTGVDQALGSSRLTRQFSSPDAVSCITNTWSSSSAGEAPNEAMYDSSALSCITTTWSSSSAGEAPGPQPHPSGWKAMSRDQTRLPSKTSRPARGIVGVQAHVPEQGVHPLAVGHRRRRSEGVLRMDGSTGPCPSCAVCTWRTGDGQSTSPAVEVQTAEHQSSRWVPGCMPSTVFRAAFRQVPGPAAVLHNVVFGDNRR